MDHQGRLAFTGDVTGLTDGTSAALERVGKMLRPTLGPLRASESSVLLVPQSRWRRCPKGGLKPSQGPGAVSLKEKNLSKMVRIDLLYAGNRNMTTA